MGCCASSPTSESSTSTAPYHETSASPSASRILPHRGHSSTAISESVGVGTAIASHADNGGTGPVRRQPQTSASDQSQISSTKRSNAPRNKGSSQSSAKPNENLKLPHPSLHVPNPPTLHQTSTRGTSSSTATAAGNGVQSQPPSHANLAITRSQINRERAAFFDTRWSGRSEVWAAVRLICESLLGNDVASAQAVLDAANLTCPTGKVWAQSADIPQARDVLEQQLQAQRRPGRTEGGIYDEFGEIYQVPLWIVADPEALIEDQSECGGVDGEQYVNAPEKPGNGDFEGESDEEDSDELLRKEKGKGKQLDVGRTIKVRTRLSDRATDVVVKIGEAEPVLVLRKQVKRAAELPKRARIKFAYLGKLLDPSLPLNAQGWKEGHVVNALVFVPE